MNFICDNLGVNIVDEVIESHGRSRYWLDNPTNVYAKGYNNLDMAVNRIKKHIEQASHIGVLVDDDCDGFTSSAILIKYLKKLNIQPSIFFHEGKKHGLTMEIVQDIKDKNINLLIIPDASSSDPLLEDISQVEVIVLDHHLFNVEAPNNVIRVNCQDEMNVDGNKHLTGVGVTYRFLQSLDNELGVKYSKEDVTLVALGQIGDSSDISDNEIRYIVNEGVAKIDHPLITLMLEDRSQKLNDITARDLSFNVIPYINAVTRVGSIEEKQALLDGLCCEPYLSNVIEIKTTRKKNKATGKFNKIDIEITGYDKLLGQLKEVKKKQATMVEDMLENNIVSIDFKGGVVIARAKKNIGRGLTGLVASKLSSKYEKPTILLLPEEEGVYTGSIRGKEDMISSLKDWCEETQLFNWVQGHDNAAGCSINYDNIDSLILATENIGSVEGIEVDYLSNTINNKVIKDVYKHRRYFGGSVPYPKIGIVNKVFKTSNIKMRGSSTLALEDKKEGVEYILFNVSPNLKRELIGGFAKEITVDIYGEPSVNNFAGRTIAQVIIKGIEKVNRKNNFDFDFDF